MQVLTLPGVFSPISDSWLLAEAARHEALGVDDEALDLCTGSGVVGAAAAEGGARVTVVDVSRRALLTARLNARRNGVRVQARRGRLFEPVGGRRFDLVTANPPYVPSASDDLPNRGPSRAWEAGPSGRALLDRIIADAPDHLRPGGVLLLVHSDLIGEAETLDRLHAAGLVDVEVRGRHRGPLGPLMREQQAAGLVDPEVDHEDVLVIRARRSH